MHRHLQLTDFVTNLSYLSRCLFLLSLLRPNLRRQSQSLVPKIPPAPNNQMPSRNVRDEKDKDREKAKEQRETREKNNIRVKEQQEKERVSKMKEREDKKEKEKKTLPPPATPRAEKRSVATERGKVKEDKRTGVAERKTERSVKQQQPVKVKAEPPPKKRRKWLKVPEVPSSSESESSASEDESEHN